MGSRLNIPQLTLERFARDGLHVIALRGELDLRAAGELEAALVPLGDAARVCLDLTELEFIDSTGLEVILRAARRAHDSGRRLVVQRPSRYVRKLLEVTAIDHSLDVVEDVV